MAWLSGWGGHRIKITIDKDSIDVTLSHFPVTLILSSACGIGDAYDMTPVFDEVGANSQKIAITQSDETTELYVEVEMWDSGGEVAVLYVSKSGWSISDTVDTDVYIYYDNNHANNTANIGLCADGSTPTEGVWDANFKAVWHMEDETTSTIKDSTSNNNDGTKAGANAPPVAPGKVGNSQDFEESDSDYITCGTDSSLKITSAITVEMWSDPENHITSMGEVGIWDTGGNDRSYTFYGASDTYTRFGVSEDGTWTAGKTAHARSDLDAGQFNYFVGRFSSANGMSKIRRNGADVGVVDVTGAASIHSGTTPFEIGCHYNNGARYRFHDGELDEIRISDIERSNAWVDATYDSQRDELVDYGAEEDAPVVVEVSGSIIPILQGIGII